MTEPLDSSFHRWDPETGTLSSGPLMEPAGPSQWHIEVHWQLVDGRPMPIGIDVRSYREPVEHDADGRPTFNTKFGMRQGPREGDRPKPVTRDLFKTLRVGELIEQGREQISAFNETLIGLARSRPETSAHLLADRSGLRKALGRKPVRASPSDDKYRRAAAIYLEEADRRNPALRTWRRLTDEGVTTRAGDPPSYELVRTKWIPEARRRGYLPPSDR